MMRQGSLSERYLKNAVFRCLKKTDSNLIAGYHIGNDYAEIDSEINVVTDGAGQSPTIAFHKAMNNFLCSFGRCEFARVSLYLPTSVKESQIKTYMSTFQALANQASLQIIGGNSQVSEVFSEPYFAVTLLGKSNDAYAFTSKKGDVICGHKRIHTGCDILLFGYTGILGTNRLLREHKDVLTKRFADRFLECAGFYEEDYSIAPFVDAIKENSLVTSAGIAYVHDVSHGGIYQALWQTGERVNKGFLIDNSKITIRQETIEICEYLNRNPYFLDGTGAMLVVCEDGGRVVRELKKEHIEVSIIGKITDNKERRVFISDNDIRTLSPEENP